LSRFARHCARTAPERDDVVVTGGEPEVLTAAMPTDPDEIERLMAAA